MALLSMDKRKECFKALGLGEYNKANIKKLQSKYMLRKTDADGIYGQNTDNLLRHLYNCKQYLNASNFKPEEFRCECNGRYCCGYPTYMKPAQLTNLQTIRSHYKKPMTITSGMRCKGYNNAIGGSISNSKHLLGQATDFYMQGVTDTLANRKAFIKYAKKLPNTTYIYGNGINIYGNAISAPYMGNAIHYDTANGDPKPAPTPTPDKGKLTVDGIGGMATVKRMQEFFGTTKDGVIGGQNLSLQNKYYPSLTAVKGGSGGSPCIKNLQRWVGVKQDGIINQATVKAWQKKIGVEADGIFGKGSMKKWQVYLNNHDKPTYPPAPQPTPTPTPTPTPQPTPSPEKQGYKGKLPSYKITKTKAQVIADAVEWGKRIAKNNDFHYGYGKHSHHNGCYYCGTQRLKKGHGIKEYMTTYCCNPFVGACWAHGGGDSTALKMCQNCNSWDFGKGNGSYHTSKLFDQVSLKSLKVGDVLCSDRHVALYVGGGKVVQAGHEDDNKINSKSWNSSISVGKWGGYKRAYRYKGKVNANRPIIKGELSDRVADLQRFLVWYGYKISVTRFFNNATFEAVKKFQKASKLTPDGIVGKSTIEAMKKAKK